MWTEFWHVFDTATAACEDQESLLYADLCNIAGQVEVERARTASAMGYFNKSKEIRERELPPNHGDLADLYNNYANCLNVEWKDDEELAEALKFFQKATEITMNKPEAEKNEVAHIRYSNLGTLSTCQEKWSLARDQLTIAHKYALAKFGSGTHWDATYVCSTGTY